MKIIIPSRGRSATIGQRALRLFPDATVCVAEEEADTYAKVTPNLLLHPAAVTGIGPIRQWILDHVPDRTVVQVDDDVQYVRSWVGFKSRRSEDPGFASAVVERAAIMAEDLGVSVFGFFQGADALYYRPFQPFSFNHWVGGIVGFVGRRLRYDPSLVLRADIDYCLQALLRDRIIFMDCRYSFIHTRFGGSGGNAANRSSERHAREIAYLQRKWGQYLKVEPAKGTTLLKVCVPR